MGTQSMQNRDKARKEKYRQQKHRETIERLYPEIVIENRGLPRRPCRSHRGPIHPLCHSRREKAPPGWDLCREFLKDLVKGEIATDSRSVAHCCTLIGDFLLATLGEETVANFLPAEGFRICVSQSRKLFVVIQKLLGVKDARGSLVWSSFTRKNFVLTAMRWTSISPTMPCKGWSSGFSERSSIPTIKLRPYIYCCISPRPRWNATKGSSFVFVCSL